MSNGGWLDRIVRSPWLWLVPLVFFVNMYGATMALFAATGRLDLGTELGAWLLMVLAGTVAALVTFAPALLFARFVVGRNWGGAVAFVLAFAAGLVAAGVSLTLLGGPV